MVLLATSSSSSCIAEVSTVFFSLGPTCPIIVKRRLSRLKDYRPYLSPSALPTLRSGLHSPARQLKCVASIYACKLRLQYIMLTLLLLISGCLLRPHRSTTYVGPRWRLLLDRIGLSVGRSVVVVIHAKRLNRSRYRLGWGLEWTEGTMY